MRKPAPAARRMQPPPAQAPASGTRGVATGYRRVRGGQRVGFFGREVAVILVGVYAHDETVGVAFRMELRRVDVLPETKHLHRARVAFDQQRRAVGHPVAGFFMAEHDVDLVGKAGQQWILLAGLGQAHLRRPDRLGVSARDRGIEVAAEQAATAAGAEERRVARDHVIEQAPEIGLDLHLDRGFTLGRRADVERAAADDDRGVVVDIDLGNAAAFDPDAVRRRGIEPAVPDDRRELVVRRVVLGAQLQDQEGFRVGHRAFGSGAESGLPGESCWYTAGQGAFITHYSWRHHGLSR